ncbi:MAG TPA: hypothetical protein VGG34_01410 [Opitutaceae bacterium]|jgi:hypothetical protein
MTCLLAEAEPSLSGTSFYGVLVGIGVVAALALAIFQLTRMASGTDGQRQIEPTAIAAIQAELKEFGRTLTELSTKMGGMSASVDALKDSVTEVRGTHRDDIEGVHTRLSGISRELAGTTARLESSEQRQRQRFADRE